jgi:hypothetical protein
MLEKYSTTDNSSTSVLLAIEDVTERRTLEREKDELLRQKLGGRVTTSAAFARHDRFSDRRPSGMILERR